MSWATSRIVDRVSLVDFMLPTLRQVDGACQVFEAWLRPYFVGLYVAFKRFLGVLSYRERHISIGFMAI